MDQPQAEPRWIARFRRDGLTLLRDGVPVPIEEVAERLNQSELLQPTPTEATR